MTKTIFPDTTQGTRPKSFVFFSRFDLLFWNIVVIVLKKHFRCQSVGAKAFFWGEGSFQRAKMLIPEYSKDHPCLVELG